jgi:TatD DNase family protein
MIDSHMHINSYFNNNSDIDKINSNDHIEKVINIGLDINTSKEITSMATSNEKMYTAIGIHPLYIKNNEPEDLFGLINDKVVAIGEIGLDNTEDNFIKQREYLIMQILIANVLRLPVIIHSKNSNQEIINIFKKKRTHPFIV